ncbi:MAG: 2-dehydropantoate 2-reductase N-terminal domain-containing protein [Streptosporangiaceae bacterium]
MRYIIIGAGAVGGTIGGCLFQGGHDVVLVARGAHLDVLRSRGLTLATPLGTETLAIPAVGGPGELTLRDGDVLVLSTKGQDTAGVLDDWAWQPVGGTAGGSAAAEALPFVCAQNGVANEGFALRRFRHVYGMCVWLPATHLEPGTVVAQGTPLAGLLPVGRYPSGTDATAEEIGADLAGSRFLVPVSDNVMRWKYGKLLSNLNNAVEALCGPEARFSDDARELRERTRAEALAVLGAAGIAYASGEEIAAARGNKVDFGEIDGLTRAGGSSWQSLSRGTGTIEADFLNGEIVFLGRTHGVPTPVNETLQKMANQAARERRAPGSVASREILCAAAVGCAG